MKRIIIAIGIILLSTSSAFASENVFPDVTSKNKVAIEFLHEIGVINGYPDGEFRPMKVLNRAELLKIVMSGVGIEPDADQYQNCFPDVSSEWFAKYVCYALEQGFVSGYPDGSFRPDQTVNRVEALKIIFNIMQITEMDFLTTVNGEEFSDVPTDQWYSYFVYDAQDRGLLETSSGTFGPSNGMPRGEASELISRSIVLLIARDHEFSSYADFDLSQITQEYIQRKEDGSLLSLRPSERQLTNLQVYDALSILFNAGFETFVQQNESAEYESAFQTASSLLVNIEGQKKSLDKIEEHGEENQEWIDESRTIIETQENAVREIISTNETLRSSLAQLEQVQMKRQEKADELCIKYPDWSPADCLSIANREFWIGMTYEMLVEVRGEPDSKNPSNYGYGTEWQWCWMDRSPMCFYDNNDDGVVDAYN